MIRKGVGLEQGRVGRESVTLGLPIPLPDSTKFGVFLPEAARELPHRLAPWPGQGFARSRAQAPIRSPFDAVGHFEQLQALPVAIDQLTDNSVRAHLIQGHRIVDDFLFRRRWSGPQARQTSEQRADGFSGHPERGEKDLGSAGVAHPLDPSILTREDGEEKKKIRIDSGNLPGDPFGGRDYPFDVTGVSRAVQTHGEGLDVFDDSAARLLIHTRIVRERNGRDREESSERGPSNASITPMTRDRFDR